MATDEKAGSEADANELDIPETLLEALNDPRKVRALLRDEKNVRALLPVFTDAELKQLAERRHWRSPMGPFTVDLHDEDE